MFYLWPGNGILRKEAIHACHGSFPIEPGARLVQYQKHQSDNCNSCPFSPREAARLNAKADRSNRSGPAMWSGSRTAPFS
jgi:hypothetical protein